MSALPAVDAAQRRHPWRSFVAVGDSFTEGMSDPDPRRPDGYRGWADMLAAELALGVDELRYANFAVRGRKLDDVAGQQLDRALALEPDLVAIVGGGNDILRPRVDLDAVAAQLEDAVVRTRAAGADVLLVTPVDTAEAGIFRGLRGRHAIHTANLFTIAQRRGAHLVNLWGLTALRDWRMWSEDKIHLSTEGHRRVAQAALEALAQPTTDDWQVRLAPQDRGPRGERLVRQARWVRTHAAPWVHRRVTGRSSGDGRDAKLPDLTTP